MKHYECPGEVAGWFGRPEDCKGKKKKKTRDKISTMKHEHILGC